MFTVLAIAPIVAVPLEKFGAAPLHLHLALSDILRCSPVTEPEAGRLERVSFEFSRHGDEHAKTLVVPADIYDPADCARRDQEAAAETSAAPHKPA